MPDPAASNVLETSAMGTPSKSQVVPGDKVAITGTGFQPNTTAAATFQSDPVALGSIDMDASGSFSVTATIPITAAVGGHQIVVEGANPAGGMHRLTFPVSVAASALPSTGSYVGLLALVAALLLVVGLDLVLFSKRQLRFSRRARRIVKAGTVPRRLGL